MAATALRDNDDDGRNTRAQPVGARSPSSTTPLNRVDRGGGRMPEPATAGRKAEQRNLPIQTVLGLHNGVAFCVSEQADKLRQRRPDPSDADCCYMTMGQGE
jgi:hypothetical protein